MRRPGIFWLTAAATVLALAYVYLPLATIALASFNAARFGTRWEGFTLEWYVRLFQNADAWQAARNSLTVALASTSIATVLGTLLGFGLARRRFRGRRAAEGLLRVPMCLPDIVLAVALLLFFGQTRRFLGIGELGLGIMILGHVTFQLPFVALVVRARASGLDPCLVEAARDLGATTPVAFMRVTLPLLMPGILGGALLAFTLSLDDFMTSFLLSGPGSATLPVLIYSSVRRGLSPEIHALSTLIMVTSLLAVVAARRLLRGRETGGASSAPPPSIGPGAA